MIEIKEEEIELEYYESCENSNSQYISIGEIKLEPNEYENVWKITPE